MTEPAASTDAAPPPDGLMVFDGICAFCSGWVALVLRLDRAGAIRFTPIQSEYGRLLCARSGIDSADPSTFLFFDRGRPLGATDGIAAMFARLPAPWRWARHMTLLPRPLRDGLYRWTARNRYRILGRRTTCRMPGPGEQGRFVLDPPAS